MEVGYRLPTNISHSNLSVFSQIAQGVLAIVAGVAENLPFGQFIAPIASFVAFVIGIVSGPKADNAMRNVIEEVVRQESDHVLSSAATASRQELSAAFNYITSKHSQVLDNEDVTRMVGQIPVTTGNVPGIPRTSVHKVIKTRL